MTAFLTCYPSPNHGAMEVYQDTKCGWAFRGTSAFTLVQINLNCTLDYVVGSNSTWWRITPPGTDIGELEPERCVDEKGVRTIKYWVPPPYSQIKTENFSWKKSNLFVPEIDVNWWHAAPTTRNGCRSWLLINTAINTRN